MGATSVTGIGHGDSHGLYKPESNTGCCGTQPKTEEIPIVEENKSCYTKLTLRNRSSYKTGSSSRIKVCR